MATVPSPLAQKISEALDFDKRLFFVVLVLTFLVIRYLTNTLVLEAIPDSERLEAQGDLLFFHIFNTLNYLWTPFALLWKFTVIAKDIMAYQKLMLEKVSEIKEVDSMQSMVILSTFKDSKVLPIPA